MIKVCHMTSVHPSNDVRIFQKECTSLAKAGYDTYLVAPGDSREENGVHVIGIGEKPSGRLRRMIQITNKIYKKALELNCDIYHFHDPELLPYGKKLKQKGKRVIFDSHEFYGIQIKSKEYIPTSVRNMVARVYKRYEKNICMAIDAVIYVCNVSGENYFDGSTRKAVRVENYPILRDTCTKSYSNQQNIIYAGSLTKARAITSFAKAINKCNAKLFLCGNFESEEYKNYILSISDKIEYLGVLKAQELYEVYKKCSIGLFGGLAIGQYTKVETLATKAYEYMMMGIPVVASDTFYNKIMIDTYQFGVAASFENPDTIADSINFLLEHPEESKRMGQNGRKAIEEVFNWNIAEKRLLELYKELHE